MVMPRLPRRRVKIHRPLKIHAIMPPVLTGTTYLLMIISRTQTKTTCGKANEWLLSTFLIAGYFLCFYACTFAAHFYPSSYIYRWSCHILITTKSASENIWWYLHSHRSAKALPYSVYVASNYRYTAPKHFLLMIYKHLILNNCIVIMANSLTTFVHICRHQLISLRLWQNPWWISNRNVVLLNQNHCGLPDEHP